MNPIFQRRHRNATGPPVHNNSNGRTNPISPSKIHNQQPELGSSDGQIFDCDYKVEPISPPSQHTSKSKTTNTAAKSQDHSDFHIHRKPGISTPSDKASHSRLASSSGPNSRSDSSGSGENKGGGGSFAMNLLESKQNMLAQVSLTPSENRQRQSSPTTSVGMTLCDIEDEDFSSGSWINPAVSSSTTTATGTIFASFSGSNSSCIDAHNKLEVGKSSSSNTTRGLGGISQGPKGSHIHNSYNHSHRTSSGRVCHLDMKTWRELRIAVVGRNASLHEGWVGQGFSFDMKIPYGIIQKRGGPCGVLAVVQALTLRNLMFGSEYCEDGLPLQGELTATTMDFSITESITSKRSIALCGAIVEILWKCGIPDDVKLLKLDEFDPHGYGGIGIGSRVTVCFSGTAVGEDMMIFDDFTDLRDYIKDNLYRMDCVGLVYSTILSRGIDIVQEDMDYPDCPMLGQHGYCSQELVNLLLVGKAISNAFDDNILLGEKILKGIESQCDIGLLSLFEHYDSCQVGSYLKSPKFPVWIVCSESHFSVLFSPDFRLITEPDVSYDFDLYYYDGLGRQQNVIKLSISFERTGSTDTQTSIKPEHRSRIGLNNNNQWDDENQEELVPPLEKCIRTKWKNAVVSWNGTEPIL